jgi:hypothetical protein
MTARGAPPGPRHPRARFTAAEVREIRRLATRGWTSVEIAEFVSERQARPCNKGTITAILRGERYPPDSL